MAMVIVTFRRDRFSIRDQNMKLGVPDYLLEKPELMQRRVEEYLREQYRDNVNLGPDAYPVVIKIEPLIRSTAKEVAQ